MKDNVFMISDASYSSITKCAGLGVIDLHTNKKYSLAVCDVKDSYIAEYRALFVSVQIALKNNYDNVVFVYDNQSLKLDSLKLWLVGKIQSYQFLWLKRKFVNDADAIAKNARSLQEKLLINDNSSVIIDDNNLLKIFKKYSQQKIIKAFMHIATKNELIILRAYLKNEKYPPILVDESSIDFYSDIYNLLSSQNGKKSFFKFIDKNYAGIIDMDRFLTIETDVYYINSIKNIISKLNHQVSVASRKISYTKESKKSKIRIVKKSEGHLQGQALIDAIRKHPIKRIVQFCSIIGSKSDKKLLNGYFNALKVKEYDIDANSLELFKIIYSLLPARIKNNFFWFIQNRIKNKKLKNQFVKKSQIDFQINIINKIIEKRKIFNKWRLNDNKRNSRSV